MSRAGFILMVARCLPFLVILAKAGTQSRLEPRQMTSGFPPSQE